jgi:hypothetical protein
MTRIVHVISGHLDLTPEEFAAHYQPRIDAALARGESFVAALRARTSDPNDETRREASEGLARRGTT